MSRLTAIDPATATGETKTLLDAVQKKLGLTPNVIRTIANSATALKAYLGLGEALSGGRFDAKTREALALPEIVANVVANIYTNYVNHIAETEIDFPKVDLSRVKAA